MRILLAIDGSPTSQKAFECLSSLVKPTDEVLLLAIAEDTATYIAGPFDPVNFTAINQINGSIQDSMRHVLKKYGKELVLKGIRHTCLLGKGPANETICEEAKFRKVDLIVMGRREITGIKRFVHDSHSTYVLHNAECSVLIVKENHENENLRQRQEPELVDSD